MENISKITKQISVLNERSAECSAGSQLADSRTAYALSQYAKISNITWDYKAAQGKLSGSIFLSTIIIHAFNEFQYYLFIYIF